MREESFVLVHPVCRHNHAGPGLGDDGRSWFFVSVNRLVRSLGVAAIRVGLTRRIGMMERMVLVAVRIRMCRFDAKDGGIWRSESEKRIVLRAMHCTFLCGVV